MHTVQREAAERDREIDTACRAAGIRVRGDSKPILDTLVETVEGQAVAALRIPKRMYVFGTCLRSKFQVMQRTRCALSHTVLHGAGRSHSPNPSHPTCMHFRIPTKFEKSVLLRSPKANSKRSDFGWNTLPNGTSKPPGIDWRDEIEHLLSGSRLTQ